MSGKSKPKDAVSVAGTVRDGKLSTGYAKPMGLVSTPESKLKSTPDRKSTSSQSKTPVKVPNYLRASTGSCHDFCKYGGRRALEEEETKGGFHSSEKKSVLKKGPKWKDIVSYDVTPKTAMPKVVPLDSNKVTVPTKSRLERPTVLARKSLHRQGSLEGSCSKPKPVLLTPPVKKISSAPAKAKTLRPGIIHKKSDTITNKPKIHGRSHQKVRKGPTDIIKNCAETDTGPTCTTDGNSSEGVVERTVYVVEPELKSEPDQVDFDSCIEGTIEEFKPDTKETTEVDFRIEVPKGVETNEVSECEGSVTGETPMESVLYETGKSIGESGIQISPDNKTVLESETQLDEKSKNADPDKVTVAESECKENKNFEPEDEAIYKSGSISGDSVEKFEPESESDLESSAEEEPSMETESESESRSVSISRSASTSSVGSASKNEKPKVQRSNRRTSSNQLEEKKAYKLKFKAGRVIELKPEDDTGPRRLKFRKPRVVGGNCKSGGDGKKVSYRKRSGADLTGSNSVDDKSAGVVLRHQDGERKEGQPSLFNNVIEETASKLVETRKSKVKALVGAFETVISLQDGKPTSST